MLSSLIFPMLAPKDQLGQAAGPAFNDPLSNVVFLGEGISPREIIEDVKKGTYPTRCLGPFLHEGTHHRCFDGPTGYALLGIESFSRGSWWNTLECRKPKGEQSVCADNHTCFNRALLRAIYQLLTPLAEGLALYGELDAAPGTSAAASSMSLNAISVFRYSDMVKTMLAGDGIEQIYVDLKTWETSERANPKGKFAVTRNTLAQQANLPALRPYRVGYDWIKGIVAGIHKYSANAREDTDVTLAFLCSYFFDDWKFAYTTALSSWSIIGAFKPSRTLADLGKYLTIRVAALRHPSVAQMFDLYAAGLVAGETRRCPFLNYSTEINEQMQLFIAQSGATELYWQAPKTSRYRHILRLGTMNADTVTLDIEKGAFKATVDGITIQGAALKDGFPSYPEKPIVEAHGKDTAIEVLMLQHQVFVCVFFKGNVIAVLDRQMNPIDLEVAEKLFADMSPFENAEWWRRHHWELLNPDPETTCGEYLAAKLDEAERISTGLYI
jgi:hypothetical protein